LTIEDFKEQISKKIDHSVFNQYQK